ncbi:MAG: TlpA disulfide reductase family protein [Candidatus Neomarinimicrobiota bacterium]|nr:TlpA disulfide reductase family protein [Candidatus Neomarinimicrobiota bacterium]
MKFKFFQIILFCATFSFGFAQDDLKAQTAPDPLDLKIGDVAPSFALMYAPGKFEFLKNWSEVEGEKLRKNVTQPNRHAVILSFFATWCQPCMKELPLLEKVYQEYKDTRIKFFLIDITDATRNNPGEVYGIKYADAPEAEGFLKKKGMTMQILYDRRGHTMKRYNAMKLPRLFVMDGNRTLTFMRRGFHEGEEEKFVKELSEEIEKRLAALPPLVE